MKNWLASHQLWLNFSIIVGLALFSYGSISAAQGITSATVLAPDYSTWFTVLLGITISLIGAYTKGLSGRIHDLEKNHDGLERRFGDYQTFIAGEHAREARQEVQGMIDRLETAMKVEFAKQETSNSAVHRRLDYLHVPSAHQQG